MPQLTSPDEIWGEKESFMGKATELMKESSMMISLLNNISIQIRTIALEMQEKAKELIKTLD